MDPLTSVLPELGRASRVKTIARAGSRPAIGELCVLVGIGALAALAETQLQFSPRIPGHAILRAVLPMSLGLALVPRRGSGLIMSVSGVLSLAGLYLLSAGRVGTGALVSMAALGPLLDLAAGRSVAGWRLYARFALAAAAANLVAFASRTLAAQLMFDTGSGRGFLLHWPTSLVSYLACGVVAGLVSGVCWFRLSPRRNAGASPERGEI